MIRRWVFTLLWLQMLWVPYLDGRCAIWCWCFHWWLIYSPISLRVNFNVKASLEKCAAVGVRGGNVTRWRLTLGALMRRPRHTVACFLPLILISLNGKSCTLSFTDGSSLFHLCCVVHLCTHFWFCFTFTCFHCAYLCFAAFEQVLCPSSCSCWFLHVKVIRHLHVNFRSAFRNSMLVCLSTCASPSSGLLLHVQEFDAHLFVVLWTALACAGIVCLSNRENAARDAYPIYLVLPEPLAFWRLRFFQHDLRHDFMILISPLPSVVSLVLKCSRLCFHNFCLVPSSLGIRSFQNIFVYDSLLLT
jgi:hypothetical protein